MLSKRALHTATALTDGSVLIAGGEDPFGAFESLATAEVYDPATGSLAIDVAHDRGK